MFRRSSAFLLPLLPLLASAQEPVRVAFTCAEDDLAAAGLLCTEDEPCPVYLELNAIAPDGKKLFLAGDLHSTSGTLDSVLLASDDGGLTWKEPAPRIRAAALEQLEFYDLEHGWIAGEIQYPLVGDAFFLITTDAGQTWRQRPVVDDGGPGSVQRFWFDSPQHGELIVDAGKSAPAGRYVSFESETGGESWTMRSSTAKQPTLKHAGPGGEPDFRFRASGKDYVIEKRAGDSKWETVALFAVEVASCIVKPGELKAPEPETPAAPKADTPVATQPDAPAVPKPPAAAVKGPPPH